MTKAALQLDPSLDVLGNRPSCVFIKHSKTGENIFTHQGAARPVGSVRAAPGDHLGGPLTGRRAAGATVSGRWLERFSACPAWRIWSRVEMKSFRVAYLNVGLASQTN